MKLNTKNAFTVFAIAFTIFLLLFTICYLPKPTLGYPTHNPANYTKIKWRGLGLSDSRSWLGFIPIEIETPLSRPYPVLRCDGKIRKVFIDKQLDTNRAICHFEDYFADMSIRARGTGVFHYTFPLNSVYLLEYIDAVFCDSKGNVVSKISDGNGEDVLVDDSDNVIMDAKYNSGQCETISFWDSNGRMLYSGSATIPPAIQKSIISAFIP
ncbi:MAG: hypothetical protein ACRC46_06325 [Thermoguttaceae bacterium]